MRMRNKKEWSEGTVAVALSLVGITFAAAAPLLASRTLFQTSPADEISGALVVVAAIILAIERKS